MKVQWRRIIISLSIGIFCAIFSLSAIADLDPNIGPPINPPLPPVGKPPLSPSIIMKSQCVRWDTRCWTKLRCALWENYPNDNCFYCKKSDQRQVVCNNPQYNRLMDLGYECVHTHHYKSNVAAGTCLRWHRYESCHRQCMHIGTL